MIGVLILQIVLIAINAICASAEIAVVSTNETKLEMMAEKGDKRAKKLLNLTENSSKFLSTIQVAITLAGFIGSAFAADTFAEPLAKALVEAGIPLSIEILQSVCLILITLILAYFNIVLGELIPKRLALKNPEKIALALAGFLTVISKIFAPIVGLLTVSTNGLLKLLGVNPNEEEEVVTEEEILMMAEAGSEQGTIQDEESELIKNIFDFKEQTVGEICTHRLDTDILFQEETDGDWEDKIKKARHTYYPVCGETTDEILGVLNTKDYFRLGNKSRETVMKNAVHPANFIAETVTANMAFRNMQTSREYFAIVIDEYGGMSGIVTLHDLIELLVGDLNDKDEAPEYTIECIGENTWEIKGIAPYDEVLERLDMEITLEEDQDFETFGGYVVNLHGELPADGECFELDTEQFNCKVLKVQAHCIKKMQITVKEIKTEE